MSLARGTRIGPYAVSAQIGVGGMGEVYRATDIRLKRDVAIKVLPAALAADRERLARFEREAQLLASLNHSHIAQINPVWSPDGTRVAYVVIDGGRAVAYQQAIVSTTRAPLSASMPLGGPLALTDWSKDGRFILMTLGSPRTRNDISILPVTPGETPPREPIPLLPTAAVETTAFFSPDGRWIAYVSDESGRTEVYVRRFVVAADGSPSAPEASKRLLSNGARGAVRWRRDGRELLYLGAEGTMMSVDVTPGDELRVQPPRPLFTVPAEFLRNQAARD